MATNDIKIDNLLIILLFMFAETPRKPKYIKNFTDNYPIFRWIILYLIVINRYNGITYFVMFVIICQTLYLFDYIIHKPSIK